MIQNGLDASCAITEEGLITEDEIVAAIPDEITVVL